MFLFLHRNQGHVSDNSFRTRKVTVSRRFFGSFQKYKQLKKAVRFFCFFFILKMIKEPRVPNSVFAVERHFVLLLQGGRVRKEFGSQYAAKPHCSFNNGHIKFGNYW